MTFTTVANVNDVAEGQIISVEAGGRSVLLACVNGNYHALARKCPHMGADLSGGKIVGGTIVCPKHAAAFDVATGQAVDPAKIMFMKIKPKPLATFSVERVGDALSIDID